MSGSSFIVPPKSWDDIGEEADRVRKVLQLAHDPLMPIMVALEEILDRYMDGFQLLIGDHTEMKGAEGYTAPDGSFIMLREDVYKLAWEGDGRARFTAAHELGHYVLHTRIPLARAADPSTVKPFMLTEPQANQFAAEILMPREFVNVNSTEQELMQTFGVSFEAARNRLRFLRSRRKPR